MNANDIRILFDYNYWAKARIMRAALRVTPAQFTAANTSSYGSLQGTLVHTMSAEMTWLHRLQAAQPPFTRLVVDDFPTPQILNDHWAAQETLMRAYLSDLTDADLEIMLEYKNYKGVVYHFYCAVNKKNQRGIAVATSVDKGKATLNFPFKIHK